MGSHKVNFFPGPKNSLAFLEPVVAMTFKVVERYLEYSCRDGYLADRPYAFNERATLSLFTGGVWQSDKRNLVLEEYTSVKTAGSSPYKGRDDMWFYVDGKTCYAEAKQQWISTRKPNLKKATHTLNSEYLNAKANNRGADVSLGILFLIPYLTANQRARPRVYLDAYYAKVASDLAGFASANAYQIIWGRFLDERFLEPDAFCCPGKYNADHSHPGFEIILCTESK